MSKAKKRQKFYGAVASSRHKLAAAVPHSSTTPHPPQFGVVPKNLNGYGNVESDTCPGYGDCVSAESAFAKARDGIYATEAEVVAFARKNRLLNGANLTDVMDIVIADGIIIGGKVWHDGPYMSVDWTDREVLCNAIYQGAVKIGVAHSQIERASTFSNGWLLTGARRDQNIDHCVCLLGYGTLAFLAGLCGVKLPAKADPTAFGYLMGTWGTVGIVDEPSMVAVTAEAWLRTPTTPGLAPPEPQPNFPPPNCDPTPQPAPPSPAPTPAPDPRPCPRYRKLARHVLAIGSILTETDE